MGRDAYFYERMGWGLQNNVCGATGGGVKIDFVLNIWTGPNGCGNTAEGRWRIIGSLQMS